MIFLTRLAHVFHAALLTEVVLTCSVCRCYIVDIFTTLCMIRYCIFFVKKILWYFCRRMLCKTYLSLYCHEH